jgi:dihydrofolate reductase
MLVIMLAAVARNGVIGRDGGLPWRLSSDLRRFKADTMGHPIIMGRKTWQGLGRPLPGRRNIVVSRDPTFVPEGAERAGGLEEALQLASSAGAAQACIVGGGEIYRQAMPLADRLHITHVLADIDGDTLFPPIDPAHWELVRAEDHPAGEKDSHATRYAVYERRAGVH